MFRGPNFETATTWFRIQRCWSICHGFQNQTHMSHTRFCLELALHGPASTYWLWLGAKAVEKRDQYIPAGRVLADYPKCKRLKLPFLNMAFHAP